MAKTLKNLLAGLDKGTGPASRSSDHNDMAPFWFQVSSILGGTNRMRQNAAYFLPQHENESDANYRSRAETAKFTNIYRDLVENLAQRPFAKEVQLGDDTDEDFKEFAEDVDGRGNNLHMFAGDLFFNAINFGVEWILVDYTDGVPENATRAVEKAMGARPLWVRYRADSVVAVETAIIEGHEQVTHIRFLETKKERDEFEEVEIQCVRVFDREPLPTPPGEMAQYGPPTWSLWELRKDKNGKEEWIQTKEPTALAIDEIPVIPVMTGRRIGASWTFYPPMEDAADLQIDLFQQESALKHIATLTAFPMLAANGVEPDIGEDGVPSPVPVGPQAVLYAPEGEWKILEPGAMSMEFLRNQIKDTTKELREIGKQPLTADSGNLTVVTTAFAAKKGNSAVQAWAINLAFALERAFHMTALWMNKTDDTKIDVKVDTDFDVGFGDDQSFEYVLNLRERGEISREATITEAIRRGILNADYDPEADDELLLDDLVDEPGVDDVDDTNNVDDEPAEAET